MPAGAAHQEPQGEQCSESFFGARCKKPAGHDGWHGVNTESAALRSTPAAQETREDFDPTAETGWIAERRAFYEALVPEGAEVVQRVTKRILETRGASPETRDRLICHECHAPQIGTSHQCECGSTLLFREPDQPFAAAPEPDGPTAGHLAARRYVDAYAAHIDAEIMATISRSATAGVEAPRPQQEEGKPRDPVTQEWGFWDESWSHWYGPFKSQEEAREELQHYCDTYLQPAKKDA